VCQISLPSLHDFEISGTVNTKLTYSGLNCVCTKANPYATVTEYYWVILTEVCSFDIYTLHDLMSTIKVLGQTDPGPGWNATFNYFVIGIMVRYCVWLFIYFRAMQQYILH
jgi:hypothetical protein